MDRLSGRLSGLGEGHGGLLPALFILVLVMSAWRLPESRAGMFLVLAGGMAGCDLIDRRIPNLLTALTAVWGLWLAWGQGGGEGLYQAFLGGGLGFGMMAIFFFLGMVGAGDVKAVGALGTFLSPLVTLHFFIFMSLAGGAMALAIMFVSHRGLTMGRKIPLPYGLAIAAGALVVVVQGGLR